jgi:hypothetical protein
MESFGLSHALQSAFSSDEAPPVRLTIHQATKLAYLDENNRKWKK